MASAPSEKDNFLIECVKERLEATGLCQLSGRDELTWKISTVFVLLLQKSSRHYYVKHVAILCKWKIPFKGLYLERLWKDDAEEVFSAFHQLWEGLPLQLRPDLNKALEEYIACKKKYGPAQEKYTGAHVEVTRLLLDLRKYDPDIIGVMIMKLLAVTYWLFRFYGQKESGRGSHKGTYNKSLHCFLSDLIVQFVLVTCLLPWSTHDVCAISSHGLPDLPSFKENFIHLAISPEDAVFQRLVLKQMLKILKVNCPTPQTPLCLAQSAYEEFGRRGDWLWGEKGADGVLRIIKDQSRYMSLSSPDLRRNYVADKTKREVSQATKEIERSNISQIMKRGDLEQQEKLNTFRVIMNRVDGCDDGSYLPTLTPPKKVTKTLNKLHHLILWDVVKTILGKDCPRVTDDTARFELEGIDIITFVHRVARKVIKAVATARAVPNDNKARVLAKIAVSLQRIIAARWYLCEVTGAGGPIAADSDTKQHQEIVFCLLAFRAVLLYMLPQCPYAYGVQQVAATLPAYAKQMRFNLHLHILG